MERKKFMKSIGAGAAYAITFGCLGGCLREELDPLSELNPAAEIPQDSIAETVPESSTPIETAPETPAEPTPETPAEPTPEAPAEPAPETPAEPAPEPTPTPVPEPSTPPSNALFSIDLQSSEASNLASNGGYIIKNNIVVAKNLNGQYVAATVVCSHDYLKKMVFKNNEYFCTQHAARFDQTGKGLNSKASKGLKIYPTTLSGNILSILP